MSLPTNRTVTVDPFTFVQREFGPALGRLLADNGRHQAGGRLAGYFAAPAFPVDVREDGDHLYVVADLPGFHKEDVQVTVEDQTLTLVAERKVDPAATPGELLLNERRQAKFERTFALPQNVNEQAVTATLEHGVLTVTLTKREESKPRKIAVQ